MARKYEYRPGCYAWNLEQCEEELFIAVYVRISPFISPDQQYMVEHYFFERGDGLSDGCVDEVDALCKHHGLEPIEFTETGIDGYALSRDKPMKSQRRRQIRDEFAHTSDEVLAH